ncbi:MAG: hypothetical protein AAF086_02790 [Planctomycetota bacterium]
MKLLIYRSVGLIGLGSMGLRNAIRPMVRYYRHCRCVAELPKLVEMFEDAGLWYCVGGGFGHDAHRGRLSRLHGDLDFGIRREDMEAVTALFEARGYRVERQRLSTFKAVKPGCKIDLFLYFDAGDYWENPVDTGIIRFSKTLDSLCVHRDLLGVKMRVQPLMIGRAYLQMVRNPKDRAFLQNAPLDNGATYHHQPDAPCVVHAPVHTFSHVNDPPTATDGSRGALPVAPYQHPDRHQFSDPQRPLK